MLRHPGINPPSFEAHVLGTSESSLFLSESHCYPRGGGQPGDTGQFIRVDGEKSEFSEVLPGEMIIHPVEDPMNFEYTVNKTTLSLVMSIDTSLSMPPVEISASFSQTMNFNRE